MEIISQVLVDGGDFSFIMLRGTYMKISCGNIGIGTTNPAEQLHYQPSGQTGIVLSRTNNIA